ncbi:MAG: hypothetical protein EOM20_01695 [Spartobacteria bacterium]|nr:hypothetical protein [Spartobacteria bacterium]
MTEQRAEFLKELMPFFIESAMATFETMVFMPLTVGDAVPKSKGEPKGSISGTVGMTGAVNATGLEFCGNISMIFTMDQAKAVFRGMMMMTEEDPVADEELNDVVGELANMVTGGAKAKLQDKGIDFKIGLPTVVVGDNHHLEPPKEAEVQIIPLRTEATGEFFLEVSI